MARSPTARREDAERQTIVEQISTFELISVRPAWHPMSATLGIHRMLIERAISRDVLDVHSHSRSMRVESTAFERQSQQRASFASQPTVIIIELQSFTNSAVSCQRRFSGLKRNSNRRGTTIFKMFAHAMIIDNEEYTIIL